MSDVALMLLKISIAVFMAGNLLDMGLRLQLQGALQSLKDLRFAVWSLLWGFVLIPALAVLLSRVVPLEQPYADGLILLGMTPCAPFLPMVVKVARGDMAYAAAFMLLCSVVTIFYLPIAVPLLVDGLTVDTMSIAKPLVVLLLAPLVVGVAIRRFTPDWADVLQLAVKKLNAIATIVMLAQCIFHYGRGFLGAVGSFAIGTQLVFFTLVILLPRLFAPGLGQHQRILLSLGLCTRNVGAGFAPLFAVPDVDQRIIVMVALAVPMQALFAFSAAKYYARTPH